MEGFMIQCFVGSKAPKGLGRLGLKRDLAEVWQGTRRPRLLGKTSRKLKHLSNWSQGPQGRNTAGDEIHPQAALRHKISTPLVFVPTEL